MNENARIDDNSRNTITALANDASGNIINVRINPATGALVVEADVTSSNTMIGSTIPGGTPGSVLFIGAGSTLEEDNPNFFWDDTQNFLGLGLNTPSATLHVDGTVRFDFGGDATSDMYYRSAGGDIAALPIGTDGDILTVIAGAPAWQPATAFTGYNQIQIDDSNVNPQRQILNFLDFFTGVDNPGNSSTDVSLDVAALAADTTFVTDLVANNTFTTLLAGDTNFIDTLIANNYFTTNLAGDTNFIDSLIANTYFTTNLANDNNFITTLTNNATFIGDVTTIINNAGPTLQIDLTDQVTGILPLANGGTGSSLSDPGADKLWGWDDTDGTIGFWTLGSGLSYDHATHTISSTGGSGTGAVTIQTFTVAGTYTYTAPVGLVSAVIEVQGGGAGGNGTSIVSGTAGGGGGAYTKKTFTAATVGVSQTVTIGAGGVGGLTTVGNPTAGGASSFGALLTANGGGASTNNSDTPGSGGVASGGDVNINGGAGGIGSTGGSAAGNWGGTGGWSFFGGIAPNSIADAGGSSGGYGSGGGGTAKNAAAHPQGGPGGDGIVTVTEYY